MHVMVFSTINSLRVGMAMLYQHALYRLGIYIY